jgi:thiamine-phosphate diphosphorylase
MVDCKMPLKGLYAIIDRSISPDADLTALATDYLKGGAAILQLRDKNRNESFEARKNFRKTAEEILALKKDHNFLFIVNDDLEVAQEIGADGVHVGKDDTAVAECRKRLGKKLVGYSSHSLEEAIEASNAGADYVAFGAIYPTRMKGPDHPIQGIQKLNEVVRRLKVPVVAIGGIGRHNIKEVLATGVPMVAMISALAQPQMRDRTEETRFFQSLFGL